MKIKSAKLTVKNFTPPHDAAISAVDIAAKTANNMFFQFFSALKDTTKKYNAINIKNIANASWSAKPAPVLYIYTGIVARSAVLIRAVFRLNNFAMSAKKKTKEIAVITGG